MGAKKELYKPGDKYEIPVEGSLGLLALGYRGIKMWREVRDAARKKQAVENNKNEGSNE